MKEITKRLSAVGATRLPGWGLRDPHCVCEVHSLACQFGFEGDSPGKQLNLLSNILSSNCMCCTGPPYVSVFTIFKISRSNSDLAVKCEKNSAALVISVLLDGDPRRAKSMARDIIRHGPVAPSLALVHPSYCLQCIAPFPIPPLNSPPAVLYLCTNLSAPACNAQLPTPPPRIIGERNFDSYNHCTTSTLLLQLTPLVWPVSGSPSRKTAVTSAAEFAGNGFYPPLPSHCLTTPGSLSSFTWLWEKSPSRKSVDWHTRNLCSMISSSIEGELFLQNTI
ncbi:hypothetical protein T265_05654 [Opisthorchis viverrini]|uniref:Uncharacterized protein n=1 Tax=Opisthorchis viverrini TaxID=6198 RepID=A0A074ZV58_OPIVI|nr:hypothetical protein T265_05654 [Opisthorchis viverrini]KER27250.1 hypothetical protein T265_05654 [Opisthorchis viverrini]